MEREYPTVDVDCQSFRHAAFTRNKDTTSNERVLISFYLSNERVFTGSICYSAEYSNGIPSTKPSLATCFISLTSHLSLMYRP